jgi:3-oxoacyl-[acyl-carrier protein] reductase
MTEGLPMAKILSLIPIQRFGNVEDVSSVIHFLCTERNMYIHGQVIGVNGGLAT